MADQAHQVEGLPLVLVTCPQLVGHRPAITRGAHLVEVVRLAGSRAGAVVLQAPGRCAGVADQRHRVEGLALVLVSCPQLGGIGPRSRGAPILCLRYRPKRCERVRR